LEKLFCRWTNSRDPSRSRVTKTRTNNKNPAQPNL